MAVKDPPRSRADAVRNRVAIVDAAAEVFGREGAAVSLDLVARRAGVGSATLYRHFPSRQELLGAVIAATTAALAAEADAEAASAGDADALWCWLEVVLRHCVRDRAIIDAAKGTAIDPEQAWASLLESGGPLLERARTAGSVEPGVALIDILSLLNAVAATASGDAEEAARLFGLVRRGIGGPARDKLPL